jgi:uncharacterized protein
MPLEAPRPIPKDLPALYAALTKRLAEEPDLQAAALFGSFARNEPTPWSDLDIAWLSQDPLTLDRRLHLQAELTWVAERAVDLVDIRRAPLPLRGRAVHDAIPLLLRDEAAWIDFVASTTIAWLDFRPSYELAVKTLLATVKAEFHGSP